MLTQHSDETEDSRHVMHNDHDHREDYVSEMQQAHRLEGGVRSPFILNIPELQTRHSSAKATYPDEHQLEGLNEDSKHNLLNARANNTNATIESAGKAPKPMKKSYRGFPYPSFPSGITKTIASTFARSIGSQSTTINMDALKAISEATDHYFGQLSNDLSIFATHAGRKKIDPSDVIAVMRR